MNSFNMFVECNIFVVVVVVVSSFDFGNNNVITVLIIFSFLPRMVFVQAIAILDTIF